MNTDHTSLSLEPPTTRTDLARLLLARVDRLEARLGEVPLAAEIQLLKRDLARGRKLLERLAVEEGFRSVLGIVEAALARLTWKDYTTADAEALRQAFALVASERPVTARDAETVRCLIDVSSISTALDPNGNPRKG